jgi:catechol 2,3-dioxygenase-like lactoylglutathione lyase family enzyme
VARYELRREEVRVTVRLEHGNLIVRDIDEMIRFLRTAFPEFRVRAEGKTPEGTRWVHVGNEETYVALNEAKREPERRWMPYAGEPGLNHLGYEVDDVAALRSRLKNAGYRESTVPNSHRYRRRVYFYDAEGNDWEFVQYFSTDPRKRNDYDLPDL